MSSGLRTSHTGEPQVRPDGLCAGCLKPRRPERSKAYGKHAALLDPWCSRDCCEAWHGTVQPELADDDVEAA